ncbi:MAG: reverse transcriptase domain-containing protein [Candidatus Paceibacterota bacterium]|jgi:retron-type reverse transcriptase
MGVLRTRAGGGRHSCSFCDVISIKNLLKAWRKFSKGKRSKKEVADFELNLEENIFSLHSELSTFQWKPRPYFAFKVCDPKLREIHKADIRDMVLYQAVHQALYQIFNPIFIFDSYSSREMKGTHAGVKRFEEFARKVSGNYTRSGYVLKCDIRKFFDNIDHKILLDLICKKVGDRDLLNLIQKIVGSFEKEKGKGLPLGNVTSQLFSNIYLNELDQFIKHRLKARYYIRYCDDFVILADNLEFLKSCLVGIQDFFREKLLVELHPRKISLRKIISGTDFLGYVSLPHYRVLRTKTKKRVLNKLVKLKEDFDKGLVDEKYFKQAVQSYLGMLKYCNGEGIKRQIDKILGD